MSNSKKNDEQLHEAGVIDKTQLHDDHINAINQLSAEEVKNLISIHQKLKKESDGGDAPEQPVGIFL